MIENSPYLPGSKFFAGENGKIISALAKDRLVPNLHDASIKAFGIGRTGIPGNREALPQDKMEKLIDFWETFFSLSGTRPPRFQQTLSGED
jgi:hypothetical protein